MPKVVRSLRDDDTVFEDTPSLVDKVSDTSPIPIGDPSDLVGRSFLRTEEYGKSLRVNIVKAIEVSEDELHKLPNC